MGKDNILEGVQNASARLPLLKNDRGKVKVIKEESGRLIDWQKELWQKRQI